MNFVERAFIRRGASNITNFSLLGKVDCLCRVEAWISAVVRYNVQDCELDLYDVQEPLTLPLSLVNCGTLTNLTVDMSGMLKFPSSICLSNLKELELNFVIFPDDHSTQQLFSGCPVLEDLKLDSCDWRNVTAVIVLSPMLQHSTMIEEYLQSSSYDCEFVILGGGLKYFYYRGELYFDYYILNSALLEEVHINIDSLGNGSRRVFSRFLILLRRISDVPNLTLGSALELLADKPELLVHIPIFTGVRRLELDYESSDLTNVGLLRILQNIPCLESFVFAEGIKMSSADASEDGILNPVPPCFLYHLDFIFVRILYGDDEELNGVKVLLKNAVVLRKMMIDFGASVAEDKKIKFCIELLKLPRGSKDCGVHIMRSLSRQ